MQGTALGSLRQAKIGKSARFSGDPGERGHPDVNTTSNYDLFAGTRPAGELIQLDQPGELDPCLGGIAARKDLQGSSPFSSCHRSIEARQSARLAGRVSCRRSNATCLAAEYSAAPPRCARNRSPDSPA